MFRIEFDDNPHGIYFAGQVVKGRVILQKEDMSSYTGIALKITGFAETVWSDETGNFSSTHNGCEYFLKFKTQLSKNQVCTLANDQTGTCSYKFACQLPRTCPSSFEGKYGCIRYTVHVKILHWWHFDKKLTRDFTVAKIEDLSNDDPILYTPINVKACKNFGIGPWKSDALEISANVPQHGYTAGQSIPIDVLIKNKSDVRVEKLKESLVMQIEYFGNCGNKQKHESIKMKKFEAKGVPCNCTKSVHCDILIPATPPTCLHLCQIIKISYELRIKAEVSGLHTKQALCMPVIISYKPPTAFVEQQPETETKTEMLLGNGVAQFDEKSSEADTVKGMKDRCVQETPVSSNVHTNFESAVDGSSTEPRLLRGAAAVKDPPNLIPSTSENRVSRSFNFMPIENNFVNVLSAQKQRNYTVFEEALHVKRRVQKKEAFLPKYPVVKEIV